MRFTIRSAALLVLLAGCGRPGARPAGPLTVTDDAGREVSLAQPARRVVSLAPSSTELLFALGAGAQVVGRTTWCKYPPAAQQVPAVGDGISPNVEAVAARQPDLVVLYSSALNATAAEQFERLGIPSVILSQDRLADLARNARLLGRLTGTDSAGDNLAAGLERTLLHPRFIPANPVKLAFVVWDNPLTVIGAGSFLDELAGLAGATNVFADIKSPSAVVSLETLVARDPDVIAVITEDGDSTLPGYVTRREWQAVRAVRQRRFVRLTGELFGRPSPRAEEAIAVLRRLLSDASR